MRLDLSQHWIPSCYYSNMYNLTLNSRHPCIFFFKKSLAHFFSIRQPSASHSVLLLRPSWKQIKFFSFQLFCPHHQRLALDQTLRIQSIQELGRMKESFICLGADFKKTLVIIDSNLFSCVTITLPSQSSTMHDSPFQLLLCCCIQHAPELSGCPGSDAWQTLPVRPGLCCVLTELSFVLFGGSLHQ